VSGKKEYSAAADAVFGERTALLADTSAEVLRLLKAASAEVKTALAATPGEFQTWYLPQLQAEIGRVMQTFERGATTTLGQALGSAWRLGQDYLDKPLAAGGFHVAGKLPHLSEDLLMSMRAFGTDRMRNVSVTAINAINSEMGLVLIGARTVGDAIAHAQAHLGDATAQRATTVIRFFCGGRRPRACSAGGGRGNGQSVAPQPQGQPAHTPCPGRRPARGAGQTLHHQRRRDDAPARPQGPGGGDHQLRLPRPLPPARLENGAARPHALYRQRAHRPSHPGRGGKGQAGGKYADVGAFG
jgi:hypothetical protein